MDTSNTSLSRQSEREMRMRISALEEQLAVRNSEYHMLSAQALATTQKLEQDIARLEQEKAQMHRRMHQSEFREAEADATAELDDLKQTIRDLNDELIEANNELLDVHEQEESIRKTQIAEQNEDLAVSLDADAADVQQGGFDERVFDKSKVEELEEDIQLMRTAMAMEEDKKLEDKDELNMLREENEELKARCSMFEDQIRQIQKLFGGLENICSGAQERLEGLLTDGQELKMSVGQSHFQWK